MKKFILLLSTALFLTFGMNSCSKNELKTNIPIGVWHDVQVNDSTLLNFDWKLDSTISSIKEPGDQIWIFDSATNDSITVKITDLGGIYQETLTFPIDLMDSTITIQSKKRKVKTNGLSTKLVDVENTKTWFFSIKLDK